MGFTPLVTAMSRDGQRGTERLHALLDALFAQMTSAITDRGGRVVGFAGDAITAMFTDGSERGTRQRGWQAARDILAVVDSTRAQDDPAATFRVGLGCGQVRLLEVEFGAGPIRRYVALTGPAADAARAAQERAPAGRGLASWTARVIEPRVSEAPAPYPRALDGPDCLPGRPPSASAMHSQHRVVTTAFAHIDCAGLELPLVRHVLGEAEAIIAGHGGDLRQIEGAAQEYTLVMGFGAPRSRPDDVGSAVACCLDLMDLARDRGLAARAGVATGETFCAELGGPAHREYVVVGDSVNHAARLASGARAHQVRLDSTTARGCRDDGHFWPDSLGKVALKGRPSQEAFTVLRSADAHPHPSRASDLEPGFGRNGDLALLRDLAAPAGAGSGRVVLVTGEPGIGKSHLLRLMASHLPGPVVTGTGDALGARAPYLPWRSVFLALIPAPGGIEPHGPHDQFESLGVDLGGPHHELTPLLANALGFVAPETVATARLSPADRAAATRRLLLDQLTRACRDRGPLTILMDDADALDELSRALLCDVAQLTQSLPVILVAAARTPLSWLDAPGVAVRQLELGALDSDATRELAARLLGPGHPWLGVVAARSGGNPLFLWHLAQWTRESGVAPADEQLPPDLRRVVLARLDRLGSHGQSLAHVAAVAGRESSLSILRACAEAAGIDVDPWPASLTGLIERGSDGLSYAFNDPLVHDVAYSTISLAVRARLHEAAGRCLEAADHTDDHADGHGVAADPQHVELLAHHYGHSTNVTKQRRWIGAAALAAEREYATDTALAHLNRLAAIESENGTARADLLVRQAAVLGLLGRREEAQALLMQALATVPGPGANRVGEAGHDIAAGGRSDPQQARVQAHARRELGALLLPTTRFAQAIALLREAAAELEGLGDLQGACDALDRLAFAHLDHAQVTQAERVAHQQLDLAERCNLDALVASALVNLALVALSRGDPDRANTLTREAHQRALRSRDRRLLVHTGNELARWQLELGEIEEAAAQLVTALETARSIGYRTAEVALTGNLGELHRACGDPHTAAALTAQALRQAIELGDCPTVARCVVNLCLCRLDAGADAAPELVLRAAALAADLGQPACEQEALEALAVIRGDCDTRAQKPAHPLGSTAGTILPRPDDLEVPTPDHLDALMRSAEGLAATPR
ncbi:MAG: AAA family ATPase [Micrococcales bacterium]|nr:AAA family ATPase [Micrococcales bacterium]